MPDQTRFEYALLAGEQWWGGVVRHGDQMPYDGSTPVQDRLCGNLDGNQGCPFYVSSAGRYLYSEEPFSIRFSREGILVTDAVGKITLGEGHGTLKAAYLEACARHFPASGLLPDDLNFTAPQYNGWIEMHRTPTQAKVLAYAERILKSGMPPGVLMIDDYWYRHPGDWEFDHEAFPDPKAMVELLHRQGFRVLVWVCPWISSDTRQYREFGEKGMLVKHADGKCAIHEWWGSHSAVLDLSNPDAFAWFQGALDRLVSAYGLDGFKFDGGDPYRYLVTDLSHSPRTPNGHCEDFGRVGLKYRSSEYRACWKLAGTHLLQRVRDKNHRWGPGGLADVIPTTLAQGLMGYPYSAPDMVGGGAEMEAAGFEPELFLRWAQAGAFFPVIQFSRLPEAVLSGRHLEICGEIMKLRQKLAPEILSLARHAARSGEPILRHMAYEFPGEGFERTLDQFMLGGDLMAAPVLEKGALRRTVRFPAGVWTGDDGSRVQGPCTLQVAAPLERIPHYRKAG